MLGSPVELWYMTAMKNHHHHVQNLHTPGAGGRLVKSTGSLLGFFVRRTLLRRRLPLLASVKLTYRCNLRCSGCPFHLRAGDDNAHMTWETALRTLRELHRMGALIVIFEGGEPFLWNDGPHTFNDLVEQAKRLFFRVAVTTNGTYPLASPVDVLWVSLDGTKELHDKLRSRSFDRVWRNLATACHDNILIHYTVNRENWRDLERLAGRLTALPSVRGMTVQFFYPYDQGEAPLALSMEERRSAIEHILDLQRRGYTILNSPGRLKAMIENTWTCRDDILVNVDPDGSITTGCYVKNRGEVRCRDCGFTPVAEASGAVDLIPGSVMAGYRIFIKR